MYPEPEFKQRVSYEEAKKVSNFMSMGELYMIHDFYQEYAKEPPKEDDRTWAAMRFLSVFYEAGRLQAYRELRAKK